MTSTDHSHVVAVQDWGGTQECWRYFNDPFTSRENAEALARDMVRADNDKTGDLVEVFGYAKWAELVSDNVAPGWEAIWVVDCGELCTIEDVNFQALRDPWWTPTQRLHLV